MSYLVCWQQEMSDNTEPEMESASRVCHRPTLEMQEVTLSSLWRGLPQKTNKKYCRVIQQVLLSSCTCVILKYPEGQQRGKLQQVVKAARKHGKNNKRSFFWELSSFQRKEKRYWHATAPGSCFVHAGSLSHCHELLGSLDQM